MTEHLAMAAASRVSLPVWRQVFEDLTVRIGDRFARSEPWRTAREMLLRAAGTDRA
jgi:hypothetical protein